MVAESSLDYKITPKNISSIVKELEVKMKAAADELDFETAAVYRDKIIEIKNMKANSPRLNGGVENAVKR